MPRFEKAVIGRGSSRRKDNATGPDSRMFYSPVEVFEITPGRLAIGTQDKDDQSIISLWPEEAKKLALALIEFWAVCKGDDI